MLFITEKDITFAPTKKRNRKQVKNHEVYELPENNQRNL